MKLSKFNTSIPFKDKFIYHNSFTQKFLLLEKEIFELIKKKSQNINKLKFIHKDLFNTLDSLGFIVDDNDNELDKVRELIDSIDNQEEYYHLIINPTMNCNFSCWYCYESHNKKSRISNDTISKIIRHIENVHINNHKLKFIVISFFGGEPLLYFNQMEKILQKTEDVTKKYNTQLQVAITSNGLLFNNKIISTLKKYNVIGFQITLDGNKEKHDKVRFKSKNRGSYDQIMNNIKNLAENDFYITLRINYTQETFVGLEDVIDDLSSLSYEKKKNINLSLQKVFQEKSTVKLSNLADNFREYAAKKGIFHRSLLYSDNVRNSCYADKKNQATINYNGDVYKCNARDFNQKNKEGVLNEKGDIIWNKQHNKRLFHKMNNKPCLDCSILPICGGGCSQMVVENFNKDYCVHKFNEESKKRLVLEMFLDERVKSLP